jgi:hypothetical protein
VSLAGTVLSIGQRGAAYSPVFFPPGTLLRQEGSCQCVHALARSEVPDYLRAEHGVQVLQLHVRICLGPAPVQVHTWVG